MKTILDGLRDCECRWPIGRETGIRQRFCCMDVAPGRSYCRKHLAEAYTADPRDVRPPIVIKTVGRGYRDAKTSRGNIIGITRPPVDELIKASINGAAAQRMRNGDALLRTEHSVETEQE
jgi:GcrA cell cycle regulator